jgi:hypothetical protein
MLESRGLTGLVNMQRVMQTVEERTGMPIDISRGGADGMMSQR